MGRRMETEYALYKGEKMLTMGTAQEIADVMGVALKTVYWWNSPTNKVNRAAKKKTVSNRKFLIKIDDNTFEQDAEV